MSPLPVHSPKHCGKRELNFRKLYKKVFYVFSTFTLTIISLVFLGWAFLHPSKPVFSLKQADIYNNKIINISSNPHFLNSTIQLTLMSKNPNKKVGIYYDELQVCVSYKGEKITNDTSLPPFYQGHEEINILSAKLAQRRLRLGPAEGEMVLSLRADGRLRWKVGTWVSGSYKIKIECVDTIYLEPMLDSLSLKQGTPCSTSV